MDWSWVYGTLVRNAGWTFDQCDEQPVDRVFEFLEHLSEYPSADVILAARYLKPKAKKKISEQEFFGQVPELQSMLGNGAAQPIPDDLRDSLAWMEQQKKLMKF